MLTAATSPPSSAASTWRRSASRATPIGRSARRSGSASRPFIGTSAAQVIHLNHLRRRSTATSRQVLRVQHLPPLSQAWTARPTGHRSQTPSSGRERVAATSSSTPPASSLLSLIPQLGNGPTKARPARRVVLTPPPRRPRAERFLEGPRAYTFAPRCAKTVPTAAATAAVGPFRGREWLENGIFGAPCGGLKHRSGKPGVGSTPTVPIEVASPLCGPS